MIEQLKQIDGLRRQAATRSEKWHVIGDELYTEDGVYIGRIIDIIVAQYIADLHNQILPICSLLWQLAKKKVDKINIQKEQESVG